MSRTKIIALTLTLLLTGCLGPTKSNQPTQYVLDSLPQNTPHKTRHGGTLLVLQPDSRPVINTTQMAYTSQSYQVAYFSQNQWAETPAQMLWPLMVESLQDTHYYRAVVTPPYGGHYSYALSTQLLQLQQNFTRKPNVVELSIRAQITRMSNNQVVATKDMTIREPILTPTPYGGVLAANRATARMLSELTQFTLQHS